MARRPLGGLQATVAKWTAHSAGRPGGGSGGTSYIGVEEPYIDYNFLTGVYLVDGIDSAIEDVLVEDKEDWGVFDPVTALDENGIFVSDVVAAQSSPSMPAMLITDLVDPQFTMVIDLECRDPEAPGVRTFYVDHFTDGTFESDWYAGMNFQGYGTQGIYVGGDVLSDELAGSYPIQTLTRVAFRADSQSWSMCVNGGGVLRIAPADSAVVRNHFAMGGSVYIQRIRIFNQVKTDAEMKAITGL